MGLRVKPQRRSKEVGLCEEGFEGEGISSLLE